MVALGRLWGALCPDRTLPKGVPVEVMVDAGQHGFIVAAPGCAWLSIGRGPRPCPRTVVIAGDGAFCMRAIKTHIALQYRPPVTLGLLLDNHPHCTSVTPEQLFYHDRHSYERPLSRSTTGEDRLDLGGEDAGAGMPALDRQ
jgi:Thiamine pyrophosphate enzyme, C-terminal TPP binding domain